MSYKRVHNIYKEVQRPLKTLKLLETVLNLEIQNVLCSYIHSRFLVTLMLCGLGRLTLS